MFYPNRSGSIFISTGLSLSSISFQLELMFGLYIISVFTSFNHFYRICQFQIENNKIKLSSPRKPVPTPQEKRFPEILTTCFKPDRFSEIQLFGVYYNLKAVNYSVKSNYKASI